MLGIEVWLIQGLADSPSDTFGYANAEVMAYVIFPICLAAAAWNIVKLWIEGRNR
jgi:hypothetical protein